MDAQGQGTPSPQDGPPHYPSLEVAWPSTLVSRLPYAEHRGSEKWIGLFKVTHLGQDTRKKALPIMAPLVMQ